MKPHWSLGLELVLEVFIYVTNILAFALLCGWMWHSKIFDQEGGYVPYFRLWRTWNVHKKRHLENVDEVLMNFESRNTIKVGVWILLVSTNLFWMIFMKNEKNSHIIIFDSSLCEISNLSQRSRFRSWFVSLWAKQKIVRYECWFLF